jgi:tetratricopeptide (TPR) repeat protein
MKYFCYLGLSLLLITACSEPSLSDLEAAYAADPKAENLAALQAAYTQALAAPDLDPESRTALEVKQGVLYIHQDSFTLLGQRLKASLASAEAPGPALYPLLDSLLANMTDPEQGRLKPTAALQYIGAVTTHAQRYPEAPQSPELLYRGAEIARSIGAYQRALDIYAQIEANYPDYEKAATALFMRAFTYGENLNNEAEARQLYELFLEKYPNDSFADDAALLLQTLGKSDEEIFQQLTQRKETAE